MRLKGLLFAAVVAAAISPLAVKAETGPGDALGSVVALLPEWPGFPKGPPAQGGRPEAPEGSAVAVMAGGYLATNVHVIGRAKTLKVRLGDGRVIGAEIVGLDPATDIALIRVALDLPVPAIAPPPTLGERVCAVGNQFGLGLSLTCGVVSALHRTGTGFNPIEDFIQTDAVVNPGGSGGALVDGRGRLVGLVSAIFTKTSDANIGVNFAATMKLVMRVVSDLKDHGRVVRGDPGFRARDLRDDEKSERAGAGIESLDRGGAALDAGLAVGDVITAIGGRAVRRASDVASAIQMFRPGDAVAIVIVRGGQERRISLELRP